MHQAARLKPANWAARLMVMAGYSAILMAPQEAMAQTDSLPVPPAILSAQAVGESTPASQPDITSEKSDIQVGPGDKPARDWFERTKNPADWFKWGADARLRWEYYNNAHTLNKNLLAHERSYYRQRLRLWSTVTPVPDIEVNSRLAWEFRAYAQPDAINSSTGHNYRDTDLDEVIFDALNVKFKNVLRQPKGGDSLDAVIGRQDIRLGDGWLVAEGTPLDGSRTWYFDAARLTWNARRIKTTADLIYIEQRADSDWFIEPFNHRERPLVEQDERGAILYVSNKSLKNTQIDGYFIYKHDELASGCRSTNPVLKALKKGDEADIYTIGSRIEHVFGDHWKARGELAGQWGNKDAESLGAWGFTSRATYMAKDRLQNQLWFNYEFLSGDDPTTDKIEAFDPLWGRWAQWDDIFSCAIGMETGRTANCTNLHRFGPGWSFKPNKHLEFCLDYNILFADENTYASSTSFSRDGHFRGQTVSAILRYKFTEHITGHLTGEVFFPGNYYSDYRNDVATFLRYDLTLSW